MLARQCHIHGNIFHSLYFKSSQVFRSILLIYVVLFIKNRILLVFYALTHHFETSFSSCFVFPLYHIKIPKNRSHKYLRSMCLENEKRQHETMKLWNVHWADARSSARAFYTARWAKESYGGARDISLFFVSMYNPLSSTFWR